VTLSKGDHFGMRGGSVLCRTHYDLTNNTSPDISDQQQQQQNFNNFQQQSYQHSPVTSLPQPPGSSTPDTLISGKVPFFNGAAGSGPAPRQKGRPRKRKPKDLESMTANLGKFEH